MVVTNEVEGKSLTCFTPDIRLDIAGLFEHFQMRTLLQLTLNLNVSP